MFSYVTFKYHILVDTIVREEIMRRRFLVIGIILLFTLMSINPSSAFDNPVSSGNTLYVGGSGEGNYTKIQDAVDNATDGDTVYVYNGLYFEHITVDKSISLLGENKNFTIIDGEYYGNVVTVISDSVTISCLTLRNGEHGIYINSSENTNISHSIIINNKDDGLFLDSSNGNTIFDNIISTITTISFVGIYLTRSDYNTIYNNYISNERDGVYLWCSDNNILFNNIFFNDNAGVSLAGSNYSTITNNTFTDNGDYAIWISWSCYNIIDNNIIETYGWYTNEGDGIWLISDSNNNTISNNDIEQQTYGIKISESEYNTIFKNDIKMNKYGIYLFTIYPSSDYTTVTNNFIWENKVIGIFFDSSSNNTISGNIIERNGHDWPPGNGIRLLSSNNNTIKGNVIEDNYGGLILYFSVRNRIEKNNFMGNNNYHAFFSQGHALPSYNKWVQNYWYWGGPRLGPFPIFGRVLFSFLPWVNFDWHPAKEPYDI
jgi:parallel beta-helix repeat protein